MALSEANDVRRRDEGVATPVMPKPLWDALDQIASRIDGRKIAVFLDYDGTLTPIVQRPDLAVISPKMKAAVSTLAGLCPVAVVSGRARRDVENRVGLTSVIYAGSHGFDIAAPDKHEIRNEIGAAYVPILQDACRRLREKLENTAGVIIEDKIYSVAVHYRQVADRDVGTVETAIDDVLSRRPELRKSFGKKVFELRPNIDWNKGRALDWLLEALGLRRKKIVPLYIGDDVTDEDAFRVIRESGIGILVAEEPHPTHASFHLRDTDEVGRFLEWLCRLLKEERSSGQA